MQRRTENTRALGADVTGIGNMSLRVSAATLRSDIIDQFLREMSSITGVTTESFKKFASFSDENKYNHKNVDKIYKLPSPKKENKEVFCNYCKNKGLMKVDCFKLKQKEQSAHHSSTS